MTKLTDPSLELAGGVVVDALSVRPEYLGWKIQVSNRAEGRRLYGTLFGVSHTLLRTPGARIVRTRLELGSGIDVDVGGGDQVRVWSPGTEPDPDALFD